MNTIKSVWYGWGTLIVAGAGAYYFAKKDINKDRAERAALELKKRKLNMMLEHGGSEALEEEARARGLTGDYISSNSNNNNNNNINNNPKNDLNTTAKSVRSGYRNNDIGSSSSGAGANDQGTITRWPDAVNSPSQEAMNRDPAPTATGDVAAVEGTPQPPPKQPKSRYEASEPYRTRRGDRFS